MSNPSAIIWRATTLTGGKGIEPTSNFTNYAGTSAIAFELTRAVSTDSTAHLHGTEYRLKAGVGENEKVYGAGNELQDTKFESLTVILNGSTEMFVPQGWFGGGVATNNDTTSKVWLIEDKVNSVLPKGRFGLRCDDFPAFNLTPQANWGIILQDWTWTRISEQKNRADFVATIRYNFGSVGTRPYVWT